MSKMSEKQVSKTINLKSYGQLWANVDNKTEAKEEIAEFVIDSILDSVGEGKSPVKGGRWKKSLSSEYLKVKKGFSSSGIANMELTGDMLDSLISKSKANSIEVGIFSKKEAPKAFNHNTRQSKANPNPQRQFIPTEKEKFKRNIESGIKEILKDHEKEVVPDATPVTPRQTNTPSVVETIAPEREFSLADFVFSFSTSDE